MANNPVWIQKSTFANFLKPFAKHVIIPPGGSVGGRSGEVTFFPRHFKAKSLIFFSAPAAPSHFCPADPQGVPGPKISKSQSVTFKKSCILCSKRGKINGPVRKTHSSVLVANNPVQHQRTPFANFRNRSHRAVRKTHHSHFQKVSQSPPRGGVRGH